MRTIRISLKAALLDVKCTFRNGQSLGFTMLLPVILLMIFAGIFGAKIPGTDVSGSQYYTASIMGSIMMSTGFVSTAIGVSRDRDFGLLKRLAGTPMPKASFFLARVSATMMVILMQIVLLIGLGKLFYDLSFPTTIGKWATLAFVVIVGGMSSTFLGIAVGGRIKNSEAAPAVVNLPFIILQFLSGVFIRFSLIQSDVMRNIASIFPLRWMALGVRSVFLPDAYVREGEIPASWQHDKTLAMLGIWLLVSFALCMVTFRWVDERK
jgi:ABC-2 type transport system permease protein